MRFWFIAIVFVLTAMLMLGMVYLNEGLLAEIAVAFTLSGIAVAVMLLAWRYAYSGILLGYHVGMAAFTTWVFINRERVVYEQSFIFSTFTDANLQWAIVTLVTVSLVVFLAWVMLVRGGKKLLRVSILTLLYEWFGHLDRLPVKWFQITLFGSFGLGILLFMTNTTVFEVGYPFNLGAQWVPMEILKIPTLAMACVLATAYIRRARRGRGFANWLLIAKVNFLIVTILMLLLTGSRGLFTFLWLGFGLLELVLLKKRCGSLGWGVLFIWLSWFAYMSWPYMRGGSLANLPTDEVLMQALQISIGLGGDANPTYAGEDEIRLGDIPMHGASLFHLLYVIQLIQDGISLAGSTFVNLIPQSLPSWLEGLLWERPLNDNWLLGNYYYHGGGFLIVANAYWNGGLWVALLFMAVLSAIFVGLDRYLTRPDVGLLYRAVYWLWLPVMIVQMGYGIQGIVRVIQLLVAVIVLERFRWRRIRGRGWPLGVPASRPSPDLHNTGGTGK